MKNNKFLKVSLLILSLALVIAAVFAITANADETDPTPKIISQNVACEGNFHLCYAVDATNIPEGTAVTLNVYESYPDNSTPILWSDTNETPEMIEGRNDLPMVYIFKTNGIAAVNMAKQFYIQAEVTVDDVTYKSDVKRYSVAEYLYQKLSESGVSDAYVKFLNSIIAFGDNAQIIYGGKTEESADLISKLRYAVAKGGKFDSYFSTGVYPVGASVTASAEGVSNWNIVTSGVGGGQLATANKVTSFVIPDTEGLVKVLFTTGAVFSYHAGYDNLNSYTDYDTYRTETGYEGAYSTGTMNTAELIDGTGEHGKVLHYVFGEGMDGRGVMNTYNNHNAIEFSFDFKIKDNAETKGFRKSVDLQFRSTVNSCQMERITMFYTLGTNSDNSGEPYALLGFATGGNGAGAAIRVDLDTSEWIHVQVVVRNDNPATGINTNEKVYIYVNGDMDNPVIINSYYIGKEQKAKFEEINFVRYGAGSGSDTTDFYMDNLYIGFTDTSDYPPITTNNSGSATPSN